MDVWPPTQRKRSFVEMSQAATLSPSPMLTSNFLNSQHYMPASNNNSQSSAHSFFGQRRTSNPHPHNPPLHRAPDGMAERHQARIRPRPQTQTSVIDLTDDTDDQPLLAGPPVRSHSQRPPQLGRSDAVGFADFIDLTEDGEPDLIITGVHERRRPEQPRVGRVRFGRPAQVGRPSRAEARSPSLFVPQDPIPAPPRQPALPFAGRGMFGHGSIFDLGAGMGGFLGIAHDVVDHVLYFRPNMEQAMPNHMDYQANAFAQRKPEHVPPPAAQAGFTRSPKEADTIICPSCEEEMIHRKNEEEPATKKGGKAPSKKDREEHPFWVVKECGHVYCNHCYQNRLTANKGSSTVSFPEINKVSKSGSGRATKVLGCAVDGCGCDVKTKDKWVGVFL